MMKPFLLRPMELSRKTSFTSFLLALSGLVIACIILFEKLELSLNPTRVSSCSFNPIITCSPVMQSDQAAAFFNIPNPFFGIMGFGALAMLYFISLFVKLPRFLWLVNLVGLLGALVFCFWLASQALFVIGALCVYCAGIWVIVSVMFWISFFKVSRDSKAEDVGEFSIVGAVVTVLIFAVMVFVAFQSFWLSLL